MPSLTRRGFLAVTGAVGAAAAGTPFEKYIHKLVQYVQPPPQVAPGEWIPFATTCRECPAGCGMLQMHRDGRVTKAEGNPEHPINRGRLCPRGQSSLQGEYDPDRLKWPLFRERASGRLGKLSWQQAYEKLRGFLGRHRVTLISRLETGSLDQVMKQFVASFDSDRYLLYEPYSLEPLRQAHEILYGLPVIPQYNINQSGHVLSFGADFLESWLSPVELAEKFSRMHSWNGATSGRFTYVGPRLSMTAGSADDFLMVPPGTEQWVALALLHSLSEQGLLRDGTVADLVRSLGGESAAARCGVPQQKIREIAASFAAERGVALAAPSAARGSAPLNTAVLAGLLNEAAGAVGARVDFSRAHALGKCAADESVTALLDSVSQQDLVIVQQTNIAFSHPGAAEKLRRAGFLVYLGTLPDETFEIADLVLPVDYPLEAWGDYEPYSGIHGVMQPGMARLWDTRAPGEIFVELMKGSLTPVTAWEELVKTRFSEVASRTVPAAADEGAVTALLRGGVGTENLPAARPSLRSGGAALRLTAPRTDQELSLWLWPTIMLYDGRTANRGWLQEVPDPVSCVSWGSWLDLHPDTAARLGIEDGESVEVTQGAAKLEVGARVSGDICRNVAGIPLGQGHTAPGLNLAKGIGVNPFLLLATGYSAAENSPPLTLRALGRRAPLFYGSATQDQHGRDLLKWTTPAEERRKGAGEGEKIDLPLPEGYPADTNLYPPHRHRLHRWAMIIDLQRCIGCGACTVACYAENNIPVVGPKKFAQGREMTWLKVVPYRHPRQPERIGWLPLPCQHCDAAPCEPVCPVYAAVHNEEGLNAQIYNRCIGTRYCSNNCPYKVRRFNWFDPKWKKPLDLQLNPEVTVRCRGVMEKCTFCVQRIRKGEYQALQENRKLRDGEVVPACVQTCPTGVYSFGDLHDPESVVSRTFREDPRRYQLLRELNTKSAVLYLKRVERG